MNPYKPHKILMALSLSVALFSGLVGLAFLHPQVAMAQVNGFGFAPHRYKEGYTYGNGVYFAPYRFTLYSSPSETSPVIEDVSWGRRTASNSVNVMTPDGERHASYADHMFLCFYPQVDVAMLPVMGDDGNGWVEVMYDQANHKTGWVKLKETAKTAVAKDAVKASSENLAPLDMGEPAHFGVYQTWLEFMKLNAKASGIYWLSGVKEYNRSVRTSDADDAKMVPVTIIRDLKVRHVRGNWLLVEVLDFERNTPIGWVRWRDDDGNLMVFPNISGQRMPIVTTAY